MAGQEPPQHAADVAAVQRLAPEDLADGAQHGQLGAALLEERREEGLPGKGMVGNI